jgi:hypothetical protein
MFANPETERAGDRESDEADRAGNSHGWVLIPESGIQGTIFEYRCVK